MYDYHKLIEIHQDYCAEARQLMIEKNHDYGGSWERDRKVTIADKMRNKMDRIINIQDLQANGDDALVSEGIRSELIDIINYTVFLLIKEDDPNAR